jgi:hypothetical protein
LVPIMPSCRYVKQARDYIELTGNRHPRADCMVDDE